MTIPAIKNRLLGLAAEDSWTQRNRCQEAGYAGR
jgi:hypothetical protein